MQVDERDRGSARARNTFTLGDSRNPIPFAPASTRSQTTASQSSHQQANHSSSPATMGLSTASLSSLINHEPTYQFDRSHRPAVPLTPTTRDLDLRTKVVSELLVYPETDISRNTDFYKKAVKFSDIPIIPTAKANSRIRCICQKGDDLTRMAMCSMCECWSHLSCYMLSEENVPDVFYCLYCQERIVKSVKKRISNLLNEIASEVKLVSEELRPVANECLRMTSEFMLKIVTPSELTKIGSKLERIWEGSGEAWDHIKEEYYEIQKLLSSLTLISKHEEDWDDDSGEEHVDGEEEED